MHKLSRDVITVIEPNSSIWPLTPREFWQWREAFVRLTLKEYQIRFRETYLGFIWVLLQPVIALVLFSVVLFKKANLGPTELPYTVYIFSGLIFWIYITNGFTQGSISLIESRSLIIQTNLKRVLIPLAMLTSKFMDLLIGALLLCIWIVFDSRVSMHPQSILVLLDILGIFITLAGVIFMTSSLCVEFKDIQYIVPFVGQILFFCTPIVYYLPPPDNFWMLMINPFAVFILAARDHFFGTHFVTLNQYCFGFIISFLIFILGGLIFRKFERKFADTI